MTAGASRRAASTLARALGGHARWRAVDALAGAVVPVLPESRPARAGRRPAHVLPAARGFFSVPDLDELRAKSFSSTKTVRHSPEELFEIVADVDRYDEFVPFCARSRVLRRASPSDFEAELEIGFRLFNERYVSDVALADEGPGAAKSVRAEANTSNNPPGGLFERLVSAWRFEPVEGRPGECVVRFDVDFVVNSVIHAQAVALFFEEVSRMQIDAFVERCARMASEKRRRTKTLSNPELVEASTPRRTTPTNTPPVVPPDLASRVAAAFAKAEANPTRRDGEDDDLDNRAPGLGLRDFATACADLEGVPPFGPAIARRPLLAGAVHAALDVDGVGRVPRDAAAEAARLFRVVGGGGGEEGGGREAKSAAGGEGGEEASGEARGGGGSSSRESGISASGTTRPLGFFGRDADAALACLTEQLDVLKRRLPNIARLASAQQRRALDGEELDGDDEGKDFDILLETAMADVVVEHAAATATKARDALAAALAREGGEGGGRSDLDRWARAARADPDFLSPRKLEGVLRFGALFRLANGLGAARERTGAE